MRKFSVIYFGICSEKVRIEKILRRYFNVSKTNENKPRENVNSSYSRTIEHITKNKPLT